MHPIKPNTPLKEMSKTGIHGVFKRPHPYVIPICTAG